MKESIREKVNKDDGKNYQIGNHDLNLKELAGYAFLVLAILVYLIVDKAGFQHQWVGWLFLIAGVSLLALGVIQSDKRSNT
ncbi:MAG: hypothetical protein K6L81_11105 [Agarilytica sp.]